MLIRKDFIKKYAEKYSDTGYSEEIFNIGKDVIKRNPIFLTKSEFNQICAWKLSSFPFNKHYINNSEDRIIEQSKKAFSKIITKQLLNDEESERVCFNYLKVLNGVGIPVASTLLTIVFPKDYAIIDKKAWNNMYELGLLSRDAPKSFSYKDWSEYIRIVRIIAKKYNFTARYVEKAFFSYQWGVKK
jgi:thermostable 8-oxoguanine DNA glycosylase